MPTSRRARVLDYLGSAPNLVGSGLGGALWPALVLLAYVAGAVIGQLTFVRTGHPEDMPAGTRPRRAAK